MMERLAEVYQNIKCLQILNICSVLRKLTLNRKWEIVSREQVLIARKNISLVCDNQYHQYYAIDGVPVHRRKVYLLR